MSSLKANANLEHSILFIGPSGKRPCSAAGAANPCEPHGKLLLILNLAKKIAFCCDMQKAKKNIRGGLGERCLNQILCLRHLPHWRLCWRLSGMSSRSGCLRTLFATKRSEGACQSHKHPRSPTQGGNPMGFPPFVYLYYSTGAQKLQVNSFLWFDLL